MDKLLISTSIMDALLSDLQVLIKQPSISATHEGLEECAILLSNMMNNAGITTELLYLDPLDEMRVNSGNPCNIPPIVFGEVRSKVNPEGKTILFYNHYDVQPVDPIEKWSDDPFSGKIEGDLIFGRGSVDDKGELITRLKAVEFYLKQTGDVPCNIKFIIEGEEEIGSPNLGNYLEKYNERFRCDLVIWESGYVDSRGRSIISLGQKGILNVEIKVQGPINDVHSSLANAIENPAWKLVHILSSISDENGKVLIDGWYDEVKKLTDIEIQLLANEPFDEEGFKKEYGVSKFVNKNCGFEVKKSLAIDPTCNISGLFSGYKSKGVKTIIPSNASVKLDFRLVPNMDPTVQFERLVKFIRSNEYSEEEVEISFLSGEASYRTPLENQFVTPVLESASQFFNGVILNISSAGTGPMYTFKKYLLVDSICIGSTTLPNKMHSPNEYAVIDLLNKGTKCFIEIIKKMSEIH